MVQERLSSLADGTVKGEDYVHTLSIHKRSKSLYHFYILCQKKLHGQV